MKESKVQEKEKVLKILELIGESEDDSKLELLIGVLDILGKQCLVYCFNCTYKTIIEIITYMNREYRINIEMNLKY